MLIILAAFLAGCTVSGAGFLTSNTGGGELEPYDYPLSQRDAYTITVMKGDTLYSIARVNQIDLRALIDENGLAAPYNLKPGDTLRIPAPKVHLVTKGETLFSISRDYGIDTKSLASLNAIAAPYHIQPGLKLQLPGGGSGAIKGPSKKREGWRLGPFGPGNAVKVEPLTTQVATRALPRGGGRFIWPAEGKIISRFGAKGGGRHNDGVNIAVELGARVVASEDGTVTYVGNELRSYGNLILIRHSGGWTSAYAHNRKIWFKAGQTVQQGQHIADAGQSGDASRPQVHFELRRGSKSVDPEPYLNPNTE